jgi:hypothetical protein
MPSDAALGCAIRRAEKKQLVKHKKSDARAELLNIGNASMRIDLETTRREYASFVRHAKYRFVR